jgi:hypothetical protein
MGVYHSAGQRPIALQRTGTLTYGPDRYDSRDLYCTKRAATISCLSVLRGVDVSSSPGVVTHAATVPTSGPK